MSAEEALAPLRHNRPWHFGPVCTTAQAGEWWAVVATGTPQEATDVWVVHHATTNVVQRVRRFPAATHLTGGAIAHGEVYLSGESLALDEMPAGASVLVHFLLPGTGCAAPMALDLSPNELPLLGAHDSADLGHRVSTMVDAGLPGAPANEAFAHRVVPAAGGHHRPAEVAQQFSSALPAGATALVLRGWQTGVYESAGTITGGQPAAPPLATAAGGALLAMTDTLDCSMGDRCVARPAAVPNEITDTSSASAILFRRGANGAEVAALIEQTHRSDALGTPSNDHLSVGVFDVPDDRSLAEAFSVDGQIEGRVTSISRGHEHLIAWNVLAGTLHYTTMLMIAPNHGPRRFEVAAFTGVATGTREVYFRDVENNFEPEVVVIGQIPNSQEAVSVTTLLWPPAVIDRATYPRLDASRVALGAANITAVDAAFAHYVQTRAERDVTCGALDRLAADPTHAATAFNGGAVLVAYTNQGEPLVGTVRRLAAADLHPADGNSLLGPFVGARCGDMVCDWFQGYCRRPAVGREAGYLWLSGRRTAPLWGVSTLNAQ